MTSFQDAFQEGLEASESADRARKEIASVFDECTKQVSAASGGAIVLSCESRTGVRDEKKTWVDTLTGVLPSRRSYLALVARVVDEPTSKGLELCEYILSHPGYPVSLVYADVDEYCHDKQSLELALVELLKHPVTGGKLRKIMDLHAKRASGGTDISAQANESPGKKGE